MAEKKSAWCATLPPCLIFTMLLPLDSFNKPLYVNQTRNQQSPDLLSDERLKKSASLCRYSGQDTSW